MTELDAACAYLRETAVAPSLAAASDGRRIWRRLGLAPTSERWNLVADAAVVLVRRPRSGEPVTAAGDLQRLATDLETLGWTRAFLDRDVTRMENDRERDRRF